MKNLAKVYAALQTADLEYQVMQRELQILKRRAQLNALAQRGRVVWFPPSKTLILA